MQADIAGGRCPLAHFEALRAVAKKPKSEELTGPSPLMQRLGAEIRRRREYVGMSQTDVARLSGTDRLFLGTIERGEQNASIETLERIARVIKIRLSRLVTKAENGA